MFTKVLVVKFSRGGTELGSRGEIGLSSFNIYSTVRKRYLHIYLFIIIYLIMYVYNYMHHFIYIYIYIYVLKPKKNY